MEKFETEILEKEPTSKIELSFFRHEEKEKDKSKSDEEIRLTEKGKISAKNKAHVNTQIEQAVAFGSSRKRTQETAGLIMAGAQDQIIGTESLEELKKKLNSELNGAGSKIGTDERLNFVLNENNDFGKEAMKEFLAGNWMKFLVERSDQLAEELQDNESSTYSRQASGIAQVIVKYLQIAPRWNELAQDETKKYTDKLERFFGAHQGVLESFIAKVIEITKGKEEQEKFLTAIGGNGFDFSEGFNVEILSYENEDPKIRIKFHKENKEGKTTFNFDQIVDSKLIEEIM